jgi:hypothetical protein
MVNLKLVNKIALFFGIASIAFTIILAIITYLLITVASTGAPTDYVIYYILSTIMPYLFIAVLSLIVAALSRGHTQETALPPEVQSTTETT